ncbi:MAG TPA: TetR/AcrR family transcriptional regulator [Saprospiraceae bacterium]
MSQDQKREAILEAAVKRFAHFGVSKTTMNEISHDLAFSKALLYYYFPDKLALYAAVLGTITAEGEIIDTQRLRDEKDPIKAIQLFLELRTDFIIKYYNILEYLKKFTYATIPAELKSIFTHLRVRELSRIIEIMERGIASGHLQMDNPKLTAELFFDFLDGFRQTSLARKETLFPDKNDFRAILKREKEFAAVFFNGLRQSP